MAYEVDTAGNVPAAPVRLPRLPASDAGPAGDDRDRVVAVHIAEGWTLGYDADGNLVTKSDASGRHGGVSWRYVYNAAGRLSGVWRDDGAGEVQVGAYGYDVLGRRVARETWAEDGSGLSEHVVWDGDVPAERQRTSRAPAPLAGAVASGAGDVSVRTYAFQGFEPVALLDGEDGAAVVECDQVGQPRLAVDRAGALVWEGTFDAWGNDVTAGPTGAGGVEVEARFPGQVADAESGLRYNRFRYYDSDARAYLQSDPLRLLGGKNPHGYVPSPVGWTDPLGLSPCKKTLTGAARRARIDELARRNWERVIGDKISKQDYVFRYLSEEGYATSAKYGSVRGYTTTEFSSSASEVAARAQILPAWGTPKYGVAIPVNKLRGFSVPRPFGGKGKVGWEPFTNSYPSAGPGGWTQFNIEAVPLEDVYVFSLKP